MSTRKNLNSPSDLLLSAVIICDDLAFRANAAETLERVGRHNDVNAQWKTIFWPVNALIEEAMAKKALLDALDAHLILFPASCAQALPFWVFDWLDRWAMVRTIREAALGVLTDENAAEFGKLRPLLAIARKHDLSVIIDEKPSTAAATAFSSSWPNISHRNFGINE